MAALIRIQLQNLFDQAIVDSSHAGLLLQRKLTEYEGSGERPLKSALIDTITSVQPSQLYELAFERWLKFTGARSSTFATTVATVDGRLFTGLNIGGSIETGVITHHTYGMPMIAGSSVKGAVRQYAEAIRLDLKYLAILFGHGDDPSHDGEGHLLNDTAGYLIWHDAWWIPKTSVQKPFVKEIVTVHHQKYYTGTQIEATDFDSPVPNQQVAVQGSFYFAIEGDKQWVDFAKQLLENALFQNGLGAKASSGYGYFKTAEKKLVNQMNDFVQEQIKKDLPEYDQLMNELKEKIEKSPKGGGIGGNPLGQALKEIIAKSLQWPPEAYPKLRAVAQLVYDHVGADRKKKGAAKDLWQTLPQ